MKESETRDIKGYEGYARISKDGKVYVFREGKGKKLWIEKANREGSCAYRIGLKVDGKLKDFSVGRLLLEAFEVPMPVVEGKFFVAGYRDNNWLNLNLDNVYWKMRTRRIPVKEKEVA